MKKNEQIIKVKIREVCPAVVEIEPVMIKEITPQLTAEQTIKINEAVDRVNKKHLGG